MHNVHNRIATHYQAKNCVHHPQPQLASRTFGDVASHGLGAAPFRPPPFGAGGSSSGSGRNVGGIPMHSTASRSNNGARSAAASPASNRLSLPLGQLSASILNATTATTATAEELAAAAFATASSSGGGQSRKRKIHQILSQIHPRESFDPETEDVLFQIADGFIDQVTQFACRLARHRGDGGGSLDVRDLQTTLGNIYMRDFF